MEANTYVSTACHTHRGGITRRRLCRACRRQQGLPAQLIFATFFADTLHIEGVEPGHDGGCEVGRPKGSDCAYSDLLLYRTFPENYLGACTCIRLFALPDAHVSNGLDLRAGERASDGPSERRPSTRRASTRGATSRTGGGASSAEQWKAKEGQARLGAKTCGALQHTNWPEVDAKSGQLIPPLSHIIHLLSSISFLLVSYHLSGAF